MFQDLPLDILFEIFSNLDVPDLTNISQVCKYFNFACCKESLWIRIYESSDPVSRRYILKSKERGLSWRESVMENYENNAIRKKWRTGEMSNPKSYPDLPVKSMCKMTADEWGDIFQRESTQDK